MKKIIILLTLVISFTLVIGGTALAATEGDYWYSLINNGTEVEITRYIPTDPNVVVIPETIAGKPVTSIDDNVFWGDSITSVTIPYGVTSIGNYAFKDCIALTSVTIPNSVISIGNYAFQNADGLANLVIPDSVVSIGTDAFANNNTLNSITLSDSITSFGSGGFWACNNLYYAYHMAGGAASSYTYGTGSNITTEVVKDYKVVFDGAGGYGFDALQLVDATDNVIAPSQPTKISCTFNGWFDAETNGNEITFPTTVSQNTTYYAQWTGENYTVTLNDGTNTSTVTAMYGNAMPNGGAVPTAIGFTFDGYYSEENGQGRQYYDANMASSNYWNIGSDTTLYAKWIASTYTVTLNDGSTTSTVIAAYGSAMPSGVTAPTKTGYIFEGYYSAINGEGTQYYNSLMIGITSWETEGGGTLYAKWTADTYTITLNDGTSVQSTVTATYDSEMPDGGAVPTKTDYVFAGYYTEIDGAGTQYYTGTMASSRNWDIAENTVLFAKWNSIPTRLSTVPATSTASIIVGNAYNLDLSTIFEDKDSNSLNYMVSINSSSEIIANESYSYIPTNLGMVNLVFRANNGTYDSSDIHFVQLTVTDPNTKVLTGTVTIVADNSPQYGDLIVASVTGDNNTGTLNYFWKRGTTNIGTNSSSYIITAEDIGQNITVEITSSIESGTLTSDNLITPIKADNVVSTIIIKESKYATKIPSFYIGKDKVFNISKDRISVNINGLALSEYKGSDVELFIQQIDNSYFDIDIDGEFPDDMPIFDISILVDGMKVPFRSDIPLEIVFKVDGNYENHKMVAVYIADNGTYEILQGIYDGEKIRFKINHLSNYALLYKDKTFDDIANHWGKEAIEALTSRDIINGKSEDIFDPDGEITRAEFTSLVVRYFGLISQNNNSYSDIEDDMWYANNIAIAKDNDILPNDYGEFFKANKAITREEMMYILYKSLEVTDKLEILEDEGDSLLNFADSDTLSDYAIEGSEYLVSRNIINGNNMGMLNPLSTSTRAEVAQTLYNLLIKLNEQ